MVLLNVPAVEMVYVRSRYIKNARPVESIRLTFLGSHMQCSYCHKDDSIADAAQDKTFCLTETDNGIELKKSHTYHYQVIIMSNYVQNYMLECISIYSGFHLGGGGGGAVGALAPPSHSFASPP